MAKPSTCRSFHGARQLRQVPGQIEALSLLLSAISLSLLPMVMPLLVWLLDALKWVVRVTGELPVRLWRGLRLPCFSAVPAGAGRVKWGAGGGEDVARPQDVTDKQRDVGRVTPRCSPLDEYLQQDV